jgi:hypothetical protein
MSTIIPQSQDRITDKEIVDALRNFVAERITEFEFIKMFSLNQDKARLILGQLKSQRSIQSDDVWSPIDQDESSDSFLYVYAAEIKSIM